MRHVDRIRSFISREVVLVMVMTIVVVFAVARIFVSFTSPKLNKLWDDTDDTAVVNSLLFGCFKLGSSIGGRFVRAIAKLPDMTINLRTRWRE